MERVKSFFETTCVHNGVDWECSGDSLVREIDGDEQLVIVGGQTFAQAQANWLRKLANVLDRGSA